MPYRVLVASDFYPPFIGGAELQTQIVARGLVNRGHSVAAVTTWQAGLRRREENAGVDVHRVQSLSTRVPWFSSNPGRRFHPPLPDPGMVSGVRGLIREFQPDVIHACGWIGFSCAAALVGSDIPLVLSVRDYGYSCATRMLMQNGQRVCSGPSAGKCLACAGDRYGWLKAFAAVGGIIPGRRLLLHNRVALVCVSRYVESIVRRDLVRDADVCDVLTIPDIVSETDDPSESAEYEQEVLARLPREPFILFVGALQAAKGVRVLLDAYARLVDAPPLVLIGSTWAESPRTFGPGVTLLRDVPHSLVMHAWERCLFGVVPSTWPDPLPGTVREAMSRGKPVIGSDVGGISDMVQHGQTGLLVPPSDVNALQQAMQHLIGDTALRQRLGAAARTDVERFGEASIMPRLEAVYGRMIGVGQRV